MHSVLLDKHFLGSSWKAEVVTTHLHALYGDLASKALQAWRVSLGVLCPQRQQCWTWFRSDKSRQSMPKCVRCSVGLNLHAACCTQERTARLSDESIGAQATAAVLRA